MKAVDHLAACAICLLASASSAQEPVRGAGEGIAVPSGQPLSFMDFILEAEGDLVRFRFLTPQIGAGYDYADVFPDFAVLCNDLALPALAQNGLSPSRIVLSMSAAEVEFGRDHPEVLQFFEAFRPENDLCIWEEF